MRGNNTNYLFGDVKLRVNMEWKALYLELIHRICLENSDMDTYCTRINFVIDACYVVSLSEEYFTSCPIGCFLKTQILID